MPNFKKKSWGPLIIITQATHNVGSPEHVNNHHVVKLAFQFGFEAELEVRKFLKESYDILKDFMVQGSQNTCQN